MLFNVYYFTENDRQQIARVKADDLDTAINFSTHAFFKAGTEWDEEGDDHIAILSAVLCAGCELKDKPIDEWDVNSEEGETYCDHCESSEGLTIELDELDECEEFKTIYGANDFYDLTTDPVKAYLNAITVFQRMKEDLLSDDSKLAMDNQINETWTRIIDVAKAPDWNPLLARAWNKDPQTGAASLILWTRDQTPPHLQDAFDPALIKRSKRLVDELEREQ